MFIGLKYPNKILIKFWKNFTESYEFHKWFGDALDRSSIQSVDLGQWMNFRKEKKMDVCILNNFIHNKHTWFLGWNNRYISQVSFTEPRPEFLVRSACTGGSSRFWCDATLRSVHWFGRDTMRWSPQPGWFTLFTQVDLVHSDHYAN